MSNTANNGGTMTEIANRTSNNDKYYKIETAAKEAGVSVSTIHNAINKGVLVASTVPGRNGRHTYMIKEADLLAWVEDRKSVKVEQQDVSKALKLATVEQLAGEFNRRLQASFDEGVKVGEKRKAAEFKLMLKKGGF